jgi:resuscitation-promoting factor RpfA
MNRPSEPFNAEERDLAERLARLSGPREPAPALDANILAAARAAVTEPAPAPVSTPDPSADPKVTPLRPRKPAPRWPLGMGLAASLVLAAGIGWRLQGDGEGSSAESAMAPVPAADMEESVQAVILEPPMERTPPPPPPPLADVATDAAARRADAAQQPLAKAAPVPSEPEFVADLPMMEAAAAPEAPPAPAAQSAPIAANEKVVADDDEALDKVSVVGSRVKRAERDVGAAEYTRTPLNERREQAAPVLQPAGKPTATGAAQAPAQSERARGVAGNSTADAEERRQRDEYRFDDRPPVSADSAEFRQAWLQRIRGHIAKGESEAARNSLQEFRRRYPEVELPEDLRKLAATLPAP